MKDKTRSIQIVLKGLSGKIVVNGKEFNGVMPAVVMDDEKIASVLTYVRNSFGNSGEIVSKDDVKQVRAAGTRTKPDSDR